MRFCIFWLLFIFMVLFVNCDDIVIKNETVAAPKFKTSDIQYVAIGGKNRGVRPRR